ncbi:MAG TPA: argininosuccinate lyase [Pelagibacterium sp.]|uniref:argininosuccinate lyase n=1 Tax=uncultured Pelagibacterium sp. TaxID=1159875 RepID=UPI000C47E329|nr:argininosuccinate lyase [Pelagibacterium sp.]HCO56451.1 argininosuccinate lyase [Pelagibacterium sp.]|tara:strand:+ start:8906 stop:10408 length:1503 start_codon:yes stop_codon:yes gene_type:complete
MTAMKDTSVFPDPVYKETVLRPLFDGAKDHHADGFRAIDRAHLVMLAETGILKREQAASIAKALVAIDAEIDLDSLVYAGEVEDFFFLIEKHLKGRLGPDLAGRLHTSRSRNDIDHTLFKLGLKPRTEILLEKMRALLDAVLTTAEREAETLIVAYTHGQPAQPTTFGHYLGAMAEVLIRDIEKVEAALEVIDLSPMGAAAITTSGFPIERERVAELLGFSRPLENSYGCIASVDYITGIYGAMALSFLHLGRPIQDFQVWSSFEVGQLYVPNSLVQISSIMPQKRNPVPIEHLRHLASQTYGRAKAMLDIMHNTPFTDMNDSEGESQAMGYQAFDAACRVLDLFTALIAQVSINAERVEINTKRSCITITELADSLVRLEDLSFRQAHEVSAAVARAVVAAEGSLAEDGYGPFTSAFEDATGRASNLSPERFAELVSARHFVSVRDRLGGPAPAALRASLGRYREKLATFSAGAARRAERQKNAHSELNDKFNALLGAA